MPKACPVCGSRKWRRDGVTGNAVCEDGHVFQDFRSENLIVEAVSHTLQKRTLKKGPRVNKKQEGTINQDYYQGDDAEYLKIQAFQLLLRYQVQAISKLWYLPDIYEMIVRDLWAYQLSTSSTPNRPYSSSEPLGIDNKFAFTTTAPANEDEKSDTEVDEDKGDQSDEEELDVDPDLLEQLSDKSSGSEGDQQKGISGTAKHESRRRRKIRVSDTVVTLILGLWIIRHPVMNVKIESLINENHIPYLDFGHTTLLPDEMRKRANREIMLAMSPQRAPTPLFLHKHCRHFARVLTRRFGLVIPELNLPPLTWQIVSALGGNPTTHFQVSRILALIDVNTTLIETDILTLTRKLRKDRFSEEQPEDFKEIHYERTKRYQDVCLPEVSVAAAWVIFMKMAYGLDDRDRVHIGKDPVIGMPQHQRWVDELQQRLSSGVLSDSQVRLDKQDFTRMDLEDIDRYLQHCEHVLLKDHPHVNDNAFPLPRVEPVAPKASSANSWDSYHSSLQVVGPTTVTTDVPNDELPPVPGERTRSYKASDLTGTLPPAYETILNSAASVAGVGVQDIATVIQVFERRIEKLRPKSRTTSRAGSQKGKRRSMG